MAFNWSTTEIFRSDSMHALDAHSSYALHHFTVVRQRASAAGCTTPSVAFFAIALTLQFDIPFSLQAFAFQICRNWLNVLPCCIYYAHSLASTKIQATVRSSFFFFRNVNKTHTHTQPRETQLNTSE